MLKDVPVYIQPICEKCRYIESIEYSISLTLNEVDYCRVECIKGNCNNGDGFVEADTPKDFKKIYPSNHTSPSDEMPPEASQEVVEVLQEEVLVEVPQEVNPFQQALYDNGFRSIEDIVKAPVDEIESKTKLSKKQIRDIAKKAKDFLVDKFSKLTK